MQPDYDETRGDLAALRLIWGALLFGEVVLAGVAIAVMLDADPADAGLASLLRYAAVAALVVVTPLSLFIRNQVYKANWRENVITPQGYIKANLVMLSMLEGVATAALVMVFVVGVDWLLLSVAAAAAAVQAVNFPTGKPMRPTEPVFDEAEKP